MTDLISDIAFTPAVKAEQARRGSRDGYQKQLERQDWQDRITPELAKFLAQRDSFYMATVSETGHPYIQHRGGPRGFVRVVDEVTLGFADFSGNRQYITTGNLAGSNKVHLFFMDYANSQRIKLWGRAQITEDPEITAKLTVPSYKARIERAILIDVDAWDVNCPQHIPSLYPEDVIAHITAKMGQQIAALQAENAELKAWLEAGNGP